MIDDHAPPAHDLETSSGGIIDPRSEGAASGDDVAGNDEGDHDLVGAPNAFPSPAPVLQKIPEISQKLSPRRSPPHVVYTKRLHNSVVERGLNPEKTKINCQAGVYTERLHKRPYGLCLKRAVYHYRRRVPADLIKVLGHREIWRTLETDSYILAVRRIFRVAAMVESQFEQARADLGRSWD
jgi:hypothetical protein